MFLNIIYVLSTISLLTGSVLSFKKEISNYFFFIGYCLFCIHSCINLLCEIRDKMKEKPKNSIYNHI